MLYIAFNVSDEKCIQWHVGTACRMHPKLMDYVCEVQADGDELAHILNLADNLPCIAIRNTGGQKDGGKYYQVQTWYGDHAKWIVGNLLK